MNAAFIDVKKARFFYNFLKTDLFVLDTEPEPVPELETEPEP
jgi:hypothetical protein